MMDIVFNAAIFMITAYIAVFVFFRKDHRWNPDRGRYAMRFFTAQSNILCAAAALLMCFFPGSTFAWLLKYIGTAAVTVTMLTVFFFLAPSIGRGGLKQLLGGADLFMHLITPVIALGSFCFLEKRGMTFGQSLLGMLSVALYGPWYLYKIRFAPTGKHWDDFYGFNKGGRWKTSFLMMAIGTFIICLGLWGLQNI